MGEERTMMIGQLYIDGKPSGFNVADIQEFEDVEASEEDDKNNIIGKIDFNRTMTFDCQISERALKRLTNYFIYGWRWKNRPIRKLMMLRARKLIPYARCYILDDEEEYSNANQGSTL